MTETKIRVILADDHPIVRNGIKNALSNCPEIEIIAEAEDGIKAMELTNQLNPDILLLDMELPGLEGVDVARRLHAAGSPVRILALSAYEDKHYIRGVLEQGAAGYLIKDETPEYIVEAVKGIARGEQGWLSRRISAQMSTWINEDEKTNKRLTQRELEVLRNVVDGKTNQAIAIELRISEKTVEKYLDSIYKKLSISSRVELAVMAIREGFV